MPAIGTLKKNGVAAALREIGEGLRLRGDNPFRARAYELAAGTLEEIGEATFEELLTAHRLTELPSIGNALEAQIGTLAASGTLPLLEELRATFPPGLVAMAELPGLGISKARRLRDELGLEGPEALREACRAGRVAAVKGFGEKSQASLLAALEAMAAAPPPSERPAATRTPLAEALPLAERLRARLAVQPHVLSVTVVGDLRRWDETIGAVELLVTLAAESAETNGSPPWDPGEVVPLLRTDSHAAHRFTGVLAGGLPLVVHFATPLNHVVRLFFATGSSSEVERLVARAKEKNVVLDEHGLWSGETRVVLSREEELYERLGLPYRAPEQREGAGPGESGASGDEETLLRYEDVRGLVHCHTVHSDGKDTVLAMAQAADAMGMAYLTITDHSPTAHYARGVTVDRLKAQWDDIAAAQEHVKVRLLRGTESDITADGALDYPEEILAQLDVVIASIHNRFKMGSEAMTERLVRLMRVPAFKIWGHPLGRIIGHREPFACDLQAVLDAAAESGKVAVEINGDHHRLDLPSRWIPEARARRLPFVVSTDAHGTGAFGYLRAAVGVARRGGLTRAEVLNTADAASFRRAVKPLRP